MPDELGRNECQRALEALRSGVPNHDAVRVMGCGQPHVIKKFTTQLVAAKGTASRRQQAQGLLIEGGFGTGKSHVLESLEHQALGSNFVCSRVVISKETPLYDPGKVLLAAMDSAAVPGGSGQAVQEIAMQLDPRSARYGELYRWAASPESGLSNLFAATLLLHERLNNDPELVEEVAAFWAGQRLSVQRIRRGLQHVGATKAFVIKAVAAKVLNLQRFRFMSRLILAAGYSGWVMFLDEVELVARYSLLQRARSYAELSRWLLSRSGQPSPEARLLGEMSFGTLAGEDDSNPYVIGIEGLLLVWAVAQSDTDVFTRLLPALSGYPGTLEKRDAADCFMRTVESLVDESESARYLTGRQSFQLANQLRDLHRAVRRSRGSKTVNSTVWHRTSSRFESYVDLGLLQKGDGSEDEKFEYVYKATDALRRVVKSFETTQTIDEWLDWRMVECLYGHVARKDRLTRDELREVLPPIVKAIRSPAAISINALSLGIVVDAVRRGTSIHLGTARERVSPSICQSRQQYITQH